MKEEQQLIIVNPYNQQITTAKKQLTHEKGYLHRAFSIFIFDVRQTEIKLLLQQRNSTKYHCANLWSNSCCSHPFLDEDIKKAAKRRMQEELGFKTELHQVHWLHYRAIMQNNIIENEIDCIFVGFYNDEKIAINSQEVQQIKWQNFINLTHDIKYKKQIFTPWFVTTYLIAINWLKNNF